MPGKLPRAFLLPFSFCSLSILAPAHAATLHGVLDTVPLTADNNFHQSLKKSNNPSGLLPVTQFSHISNLGFGTEPLQAC